MSSSYLAMGSALYSRLASQGTVPVYQNLAPQGGTPPYCVFQLQSGVDEYAFADASKGIVEAIYAVRVVSNRTWPGESQVIYDGNIHGALQGAALSVGGHNLLRCERASLIPSYQDADKYWHTGGLYRVWVQPT